MGANMRNKFRGKKNPFRNFDFDRARHLAVSILLELNLVFLALQVVFIATKRLVVWPAYAMLATTVVVLAIMSWELRRMKAEDRKLGIPSCQSGKGL